MARVVKPAHLPRSEATIPATSARTVLVGAGSGLVALGIRCLGDTGRSAPGSPVVGVLPRPHPGPGNHARFGSVAVIGRRLGVCAAP
jgi:hypothetical protein